jgi:WD40 repeat protein
MTDTPHDDRAARLAELQDDLSRCWTAGQRVPVEDYLTRHAWLRDDSAAALELVCHEVLLRQELGDAPRLDEFTQRFPQHAPALRRLFAIQAMVEEVAPPTPGMPAPGDVITPREPRDGETRIRTAASEVSTAHRASSSAGPGNRPPGCSDAAAPRRPLPPPDGYEILEELGRGGMGVVYRARQLNLNRIVALKMVLAGPYADGAALARFRAEAAAVARLQHPGIVQIFEMGEADGWPFFAMEYVAGGNLAARAAGTPQPPRDVAALVERIARAIAATHEQGIVHRDLKPANVLLAGDAAGPLAQAEPKIVDFGVAKFLDVEGPSATVTHDVLGTPLYMAPEQAAGQSKDAGPAVDIYALGVILYVLLTGQPPFRGATLLDTLTQIKTSDPVPPRRLLPQVPRDLETICLKCLQKEPHKRYATALALADDLRRFSGGQPVLARPTAWWERGLKWARREPRVAALVAAVAAVTIAGLVTTAILWRVAERRAEGEAQQRQQVEQQLYFFRIGLADRELQAGRVAWAREQLELCPAPLRHWEWHHLMRQCEGSEAVKVYAGHDGKVAAVAFSPDGRRFATASSDATVRVWDAAQVVAAAPEPVAVLKGHRGSVNTVAFNGRGDRLVSGGEDGHVIVWNTGTWKKELVLDRHNRASVSGGAQHDRDGGVTSENAATGGPILSAIFDPRGVDLASSTFDASGPSNILIRNCRTGEIRVTLKGHTDSVTGLAYSPDGQLLFSSSHDHTVRVWNTHSGETVRVFEGHALPVSGLAVSRDGRLVASAAGRSQADQPDEGNVLIWEASSGRIVHRLQGHRERPLAMAFTPDGQRLATAGWDPQIKLWDVAGGQEVLALRGHAGGDARGVMGLCFDPQGHLLVSAGIDTTARIWSGAESGGP